MSVGQIVESSPPRWGLPVNGSAMVSRTANLADRVLRNGRGRENAIAVYAAWHGHQVERLSWRALGEQVADCRNSLLRLGVSPGDRIVAQVSPGTAALVAFLSVAAAGAVWVSVDVDDDVAQTLTASGTKPKLVICSDGHLRGGRPITHDVAAVVARCTPPTTRVVLVPDLDADACVAGTIEWGRLFAEPGVLDVTAVADDHPLCIDSAGDSLTHGDAATAALHVFEGAERVRHDSVVTFPAAVGSRDWVRLIGALSLGVVVALGGPADPRHSTMDMRAVPLAKSRLTGDR